MTSASANQEDLPRAEHVGGGAGDEDVTDQPSAAAADRLGHDVAFLAVERAERGEQAQRPVLGEHRRHALGQLSADVVAAGPSVGAADDLAALVGDEDVVARAVGDRAEVHAQRPGVQPVVIRDGGGQTRDLAGARFHRRLIVVDDVAAGDADKGERREQEADGDQRGRGHEVPQIDAFHYSLTSNL